MKSKPPKAAIEKTPTSRNWQRAFLVALFSALLILTLYVVLTPPPQAPAYSDEVFLRNAEFALNENRLIDVEKFVSLIGEKSPHYAKAQLLAGEAATKSNRMDDAIRYYRKVPENAENEYTLALYSLAEVMRFANRWDESLKNYEQVIERAPDQAECRERIAFLLGVSGQRWNSIPHLMALIRLRGWDLQTLAVLTDIERPIEQHDLINEIYQPLTKDRLIRLAKSHHLLIQGDLAYALPMLEQLTQEAPDLLAAQEMLGEVLHQLGDLSKWEKWNEQLPESAEQSPGVWFVRGQQARTLGELGLAAGCYARALELAPEYRQASYQLGQVLTKLGESGADELIEHARVQSEISQQLDLILKSDGKSQEAIRKVAESCEKLGRFHEAWAWSKTSEHLHGVADWNRRVIRQAETHIIQSSDRTAADFRLDKRLSLKRFASLASPNSFASKRGNQIEMRVSPSLASKLRFDSVKDRGFDFTYENADDPATKGVRMFEQTGGGLGVIDYDKDGWPDLYMTQGARWQTGDLKPTPTEELHDVLFRNHQGQKFQDVALRAGIRELDYSQGVAVNDVNNDGFDDLFVGVIGLNRLFINNGDGTFSEASLAIPNGQDAWTTSTVIVDLNGDSFPDLFEANYLQGKELFTLICNGKGCSPSVFDGCTNRCWLNGGDGTFREISLADGAVEHSKSLGLVAFIAEGERLPSLFVSNDQVPNFLLVPQLTPAGEFQLSDEGLIRGLALNVDALSMACMGIAADDIDNNGTTDFVVTNFSNEANSVYLQDSSGLFTDATLAAGMQTASYPYVGWGTQFLDADRDGLSDVVVVNGHIDDYRDQGGEFEMAPQFYRNIGGGRLAVQKASDLGDFFGGKYLSRALAKLDWNRDGLVDFAVSNIRMRSDLLLNASTAGHYIEFQLVGTQSARHPVGARLTLKAGTKTWKKQLTTGDGYQCTNEKVLQFGLGDTAETASVEIQWPSGSKAMFENLYIDRRYLVVEGQSLITTVDSK